LLFLVGTIKSGIKRLCNTFSVTLPITTFPAFPAMRSNNDNICFQFFCGSRNRIGKITFFDNCLNVLFTPNGFLMLQEFQRLPPSVPEHCLIVAGLTSTNPGKPMIGEYPDVA